MYRLRSGIDHFYSEGQHKTALVPTYGDKLFVIDDETGTINTCLNELEQPKPLAKHRMCLNRLAGNEIGNDLLSALLKNDLLTKVQESALTASQKERYNRQINFFEQAELSKNPEQAQERLLDSTVGIVGLGGAGSPIAELLAGAGIGKLKLCDYDTVDLSNLNRQLSYTEDDINEKKTKCLANRLSSLNGEIEIEVDDSRFDSSTSDHFFTGSDLVVIAADEPPGMICEYASIASESTGTPFMTVSNIPQEIRIGPLFSQNGTRYIEYRKILKERWPLFEEYETAGSCKNNKAATSWSCYALGAIAVGEIIQYLISGDTVLLRNKLVLKLNEHKLEVIPTSL